VSSASVSATSPSHGANSSILFTGTMTPHPVTAVALLE